MKNKGFTLIELLVVVGIIGILATLIVVNIPTFRAKSSDVRRVADIKSIQEGLMMYHSNHQEYPNPYLDPGIELDGTDELSYILINDGVMRGVPGDPLDYAPYGYFYISNDGTNYQLKYYLETDSVHSRSQGENTVSP